MLDRTLLHSEQAWQQLIDSYHRAGHDWSRVTAPLWLQRAVQYTPASRAPIDEQLYWIMREKAYAKHQESAFNAIDPARFRTHFLEIAPPDIVARVLHTPALLPATTSTMPIERSVNALLQHKLKNVDAVYGLVVSFLNNNDIAPLELSLKRHLERTFILFQEDLIMGHLLQKIDVECAFILDQINDPTEREIIRLAFLMEFRTSAKNKHPTELHYNKELLLLLVRVGITVSKEGVISAETEALYKKHAFRYVPNSHKEEFCTLFDIYNPIQQVLTKKFFLTIPSSLLHDSEVLSTFLSLTPRSLLTHVAINEAHWNQASIAALIPKEIIIETIKEFPIWNSLHNYLPLISEDDAIAGLRRSIGFYNKLDPFMGDPKICARVKEAILSNGNLEHEIQYDIGFIGFIIEDLARTTYEDKAFWEQWLSKTPSIIHYSQRLPQLLLNNNKTLIRQTIIHACTTLPERLIYNGIFPFLALRADMNEEELWLLFAELAPLKALRIAIGSYPYLAEDTKWISIARERGLSLEETPTATAASLVDPLHEALLESALAYRVKIEGISSGELMDLLNEPSFTRVLESRHLPEVNAMLVDLLNRFKNDLSILVHLLPYMPEYFNQLDPALKDNPLVVMAVQHCLEKGILFSSLSDRYKQDSQIVWAAIRNNPALVSQLPAPFNQDLEIAIYYIQNLYRYQGQLPIIPPTYFQDPKILKIMLNTISAPILAQYFYAQRAAFDAATKKAMAFTLISKNAFASFFVNRFFPLVNDLELKKIALSQNVWVTKVISEIMTLEEAKFALSLDPRVHSCLSREHKEALAKEEAAAKAATASEAE